MTFDEIIRKYRVRIINSNDKKEEVSKIIQEIDSLINTKNKLPISNEYKIKLLEQLRQEFVQEQYELSALDNKDYLELINQTIKTLGGK